MRTCTIDSGDIAVEYKMILKTVWQARVFPKFRTHKKHPYLTFKGELWGCLLWVLRRKITARYPERTEPHYNDVIISAMVSQITSASIFFVYSAVCSGTDQRKHQSSASLAFVRGIHRLPVNSPHKGPVTRQMFPFDDVIMQFHIMHVTAVLFVRVCEKVLWRFNTYNALKTKGRQKSTTLSSLVAP